MVVRRRILAAVICIMLLVTACSGARDSLGLPGNGEGQAAQEGADGNRGEPGSGNEGEGTSEGDVTKPGNEGSGSGFDGSVNIYTVGEDILAVAVQSALCMNLLPKNENEASDIELHISSAYNESGYSMFQLTMNTYYPYIYYYETAGGEGQHVSGFFDSDSHAVEDGYFALIYEKGLVSKLKLEGPFTLFEFKNGEGTEVASFAASEVVKTLSLEELIDKGAQILHKEKPLGNFEGTYLSDSYSTEHIANATVKVTEHNGVYFKGKVDGEDIELIGFEDYEPEYQQSDYNYSRIRALNTPEGITYELAWYRYYQNEVEYDEGMSLNYDDYSGSETIYYGISLHPFKERWVAPTDYEDKDRTGNLSVKDPQDNTYFSPESDDYVLLVRPTYNYDESTVDFYTLSSFNEIGFMIGEKYKFRCASEAEAKVFYDARIADPYDDYEYHQAGNVVYSERTKSPGLASQSKKDTINYTTSYLYKNVSYLYGWYDDDAKRYSTEMFLSKPYTDEDVRLSVDDSVYWQGVPESRGGYYKSTDGGDARLMVYMAEEYAFPSFGFTGEAFPSNTFATIRFTGREVVAVSFAYEWTESGEMYYYDFMEIKFEEGKAVATQYRFPAGADLFSAKCEVTLDNFRTKTPLSTVTKTFDLTRGESVW